MVIGSVGKRERSDLNVSIERMNDDARKRMIMNEIY